MPQAPAMAPPADVPCRLPFTALWALLIGIGIAFTPCVLPMYPLISGIVLGGKQRLSTAARPAAGLYLRPGDGPDLYRAGAGGSRRRAAVPGGAAAPICAGRPVGGVYTAGALHVRPVHAALPSSLQTRLMLLSKQAPGRLARRRLCDGRYCRADLLPLHHRAAKRHSVVYRPER